jgi:hypothetical protein
MPSSYKHGCCDSAYTGLPFTNDTYQMETSSEEVRSPCPRRGRFSRSSTQSLYSISLPTSAQTSVRRTHIRQDGLANMEKRGWCVLVVAPSQRRWILGNVETIRLSRIHRCAEWIHGSVGQTQTDRQSPPGISTWYVDESVRLLHLKNSQIMTYILASLKS